MIEPGCSDLEVVPAINQVQFGGVDRMQTEFEIVVANRGVPQPLQVHLPRGRVVQVHDVSNLIGTETHQNPGQTKAVIPMKMGEADLGDHRRGEAGKSELALGAFPRIKQDAVLIPSQEVAIVVTVPGGRLA